MPQSLRFRSEPSPESSRSPRHSSPNVSYSLLFPRPSPWGYLHSWRPPRRHGSPQERRLSDISFGLSGRRSFDADFPRRARRRVDQLCAQTLTALLGVRVEPSRVHPSSTPSFRAQIKDFEATGRIWRPIDRQRRRFAERFAELHLLPRTETGKRRNAARQRRVLRAEWHGSRRIARIRRLLPSFRSPNSALRPRASIRNSFGTSISCTFSTHSTQTPISSFDWPNRSWMNRSSRTRFHGRSSSNSLGFESGFHVSPFRREFKCWKTWIFSFRSFTRRSPISRHSPLLRRFVPSKRRVIAVIECDVATFFLKVLEGVRALDASFSHEEIEKVLVANRFWADDW